MTLQEAIGLFRAYRDAKPYIQFQTFVESLGRTNNKALIESISHGVSVIIEGAFIRQYDSSMRKYLKTPSAQEIAALLAAGKKNELTNYIYGALIMEADSKYPNPEQLDKAEEYYTRMVTYFADHKELLNNYDPKYSLTTYVHNFVAKPVLSMFKNKLSIEQKPTEAHIDAKVAYNKQNKDKIKPDGSNKWGKIIDDSANDGTVIVKWTGVKGPAGDWKIKPYNETVSLNELDVYDLTEGARFQSENTALDSAEGKDGGLKETLKDTAHYADKSHGAELYDSEISNDINDAIDIVAEVALESGKFKEADAENIKTMLKNELDSVITRPRITILKKRQNEYKTNIKKLKDPAQAQGELNAITAELEKLHNENKGSFGTDEFGQAYGFSLRQAKSLWRNFMSTLKGQPAVIKYLNTLRKEAAEPAEQTA